MLERYFGLEEHGTSVRTELLAGLTTFLTMAYIVFVNPAILSDAGMDFGAVFTVTCVTAALGSGLMGLLANYPIAQAPGMGINAFFTYTVVLGMGHTWQVALGAVFFAGILFVVISVLPVREWIINSIPMSLKLATSAGIGLFLGLIALQNAGLVVANKETMVSLGDITAPTVMLALAGFVVIAALDALKVTGAILIGILAVTAVGIATGQTGFDGIASLPPDPSPTLFALDLADAFDAGLIAVVVAFLITDLFDTTGTLIGVSQQAGLLDEKGRLPRLKRALLADSTATVIGALGGTSPVTSYVESAAGVRAGGRTGLTAVVVAVLFMAALFLSPLAHTVPSYATAPALLFVATMMVKGVADLDWTDVTEYAPGVVLALAMPFTYSITDGLALGFITYALLKLACGRFSEARPAVLVLAAIFIAKYAWLGG
jgi:AGZA family xanthine/uracil permease-like MFS transporter